MNNRCLLVAIMYVGSYECMYLKYMIMQQVNLGSLLGPCPLIFRKRTYIFSIAYFMMNLINIRRIRIHIRGFIPFIQFEVGENSLNG